MHLICNFNTWGEGVSSYYIKVLLNEHTVFECHSIAIVFGLSSWWGSLTQVEVWHLVRWQGHFVLEVVQRHRLIVCVLVLVGPLVGWLVPLTPAKTVRGHYLMWWAHESIWHITPSSVRVNNQHHVTYRHKWYRSAASANISPAKLLNSPLLFI